MVRRLAKLILLIGLCWAAVWGLSSAVAPKAADLVVAALLPRLDRAGLVIDSLSYGEIDLAPSLTRASTRDVEAAFDLKPSDDIQLRSTFTAREVSLWIDQFWRLRGGLSIESFEVDFDKSDLPSRFPFDRLTEARLVIGNLPLLAPRRALAETRSRLEATLVANAPVDDFQLYGVVMVEIKGTSLPARLYSERQDGRFRLRFDRDDLETLVERARVDFSSEQVEIIALHPVRVPFLIEITRQARKLAWDAYPESRYRRDALRHVAWSHLLTTEFGPEFAKEVTDAQETRPGNTEQERAMDYHNNAVGRRLASEGVRLESLPGLIESHPDIIRHPSEVDSRQELLR